MSPENTLYYGDNLDVLPRIPAESVDLIYLDPPFKSNAAYNILFRSLKGDPSSAQIHAFDDTWSWSIEAESAFQALATSSATPPELTAFLRAMFQILGKSDMMAYLVMMAPRLVEMRRVLKLTGSIYLHCDPTASHYLKLLMDSIFGASHFVNEIIWHYHSGGIPKTNFAKKHDVILYYGRSQTRFFDTDAASIPRNVCPECHRLEDKWNHLKKNVDTDGRVFRTIKSAGKVYSYYDDEPAIAPDVWLGISHLQQKDPERLGYPTQKPLALLERIIKSSCPPDGVVLDPFCGCGTAVDAAQQLGRAWIGIDVTYIAVDLITKRILHRYGNQATFRVDGIPQDAEGADALAAANKIDFERWAVSVVSGQPTKASGDEGIDGKIFFARTYKEPLDVGVCVVSVKGGATVGPDAVRDLAGTVSGSGSQMGLLLTRVPPSPGMLGEAAKHGSYIHEATGTIFPCIQLLTVGQLLNGEQPKVPSPLPPYMQASWAPGSEAVPLF